MAFVTMLLPSPVQEDSTLSTFPETTNSALLVKSSVLIPTMRALRGAWKKNTNRPVKEQIRVIFSVTFMIFPPSSDSRMAQDACGEMSNYRNRLNIAVL
jgi:hypothetical protein